MFKLGDAATTVKTVARGDSKYYPTTFILLKVPAISVSKCAIC